MSQYLSCVYPTITQSNRNLLCLVCPQYIGFIIIKKVLRSMLPHVIVMCIFNTKHFRTHAVQHFLLIFNKKSHYGEVTLLFRSILYVCTFTYTQLYNAIHSKTFLDEYQLTFALKQTSNCTNLLGDHLPIDSYLTHQSILSLLIRSALILSSFLHSLSLDAKPQFHTMNERYSSRAMCQVAVLQRPKCSTTAPVPILQ